MLYPVFFILYYWGNWEPLVAVKDIGEIVLTLFKVPFLGATWFLPALFWVSVAVHIIMSLLGNSKFTDLGLLLIGILVALLGFQITFPYKISRVCICAMFYVVGYLYQKYIRKYITYLVSTVIAAISIVAYVFCVRDNTIYMGENIYDDKLLFVVGALLATYFTLWLSETFAKIGENNFVVKSVIYLGTNSLDVLIWHALAFRLVILIQIIINGESISALAAFPVYDATGFWWFAYLLTGIGGSLLWKFILEHNPLSVHMKKVHMIR